jgi:hypothetical protein
MDSNKQKRICDCWLRVGGCFCDLNTKKDEREPTNTNEKSDKEHSGDSKRNPKPDEQSKRPLDWDARDLKTDEWVSGSPGSTKGEYTHRFWEEE